MKEIVKMGGFRGEEYNGEKKRNPAKDSKKKSVRCNGVRIPRYGGAGGGKGLGVGNVKRKGRGREDDKAESGIRKTT